MKKLFGVLFFALFICLSAQHQKGSVRLGGGLGLAFGNNSYVGVNIAPAVGYFVTDKLEAGLSAGYQYNSNDFFKSTLFSVGPFANYFVMQNLFLRGQYEFYTGNQEDLTNNNKFSLNENALWLGGGYQSQGRIGFQAGVLYNVLYDENNSIFASAVRPFVGVAVNL